MKINVSRQQFCKFTRVSNIITVFYFAVLKDGCVVSIKILVIKKESVEKSTDSTKIFSIR